MPTCAKAVAPVQQPAVDKAITLIHFDDQQIDQRDDWSYDGGKNFPICHSHSRIHRQLGDDQYMNLNKVKTGVYICHCGTNIAGKVDVAAVAEYARSLDNVVLAGITPTCAPIPVKT